MNHAFKTLGLRVLVSGSCLVATSCASEVGNDAAPEAVATTEAALYSQHAVGWLSGESVPVCFTTSGLDAEKATLRDSLVNTWQSIANISFSGFGPCPTTGTTMYIRVELVGGTTGSDWAHEGKADALQAPSHAANDPSAHIWAPPGMPSVLQSNTVHEFGHVLGFSHEFDRAENMDPDPNCNPDGSIPGTVWSAYDAHSVMGYCNAPYGGALTAGDAAGAQAAYRFVVNSSPLSIPSAATTTTPIGLTLFYEGPLNKTFRSVAISDCCTGTPSGSTDLPTPSVASGAMDSQPTVVVDGSAYFVFWKGRDGKLWSSIGSDGNHWMPQVLDPGPVNMRPAAILKDETIAVFYRSTGGSIFVKRGTASDGWLPAVNLNTGQWGYLPSPVALSAGVFEVFWVGLLDKKLWHSRSVDGGATWSSPESLLTIGTVGPQAVGQPDGTTDVFWQGSGGYLMHFRRTSSGTILPLEQLNNGLAESPLAVLTAPGKVEVFWRGTNANLWRRAALNNVWSAPVDMNEPLGPSSIASVVADASGAIDITWRDGSITGSGGVILKRYRPLTGWLPRKVLTAPLVF